MNSRTRVRPLALLLACGVLLCALGGVAYAAARTVHGVTPVSPKPGATVPARKPPTFKLRVKGSGQVWVYVCKSGKKDKEGLICNDESIGRARKHGGVYRYKPAFFDFPEFWLNTPGTYYWQAHRVDCNASDCAQEGPVTRFKVG